MVVVRMCMYVCTYVCIMFLLVRKCTYVCTYVHAYVQYVHICTYVLLYTYVHTYVHTCMYVCMHLGPCVRVSEECLSFGNIECGRSSTGVLRVRNDSPAPALFKVRLVGFPCKSTHLCTY